MRVRMTAPRGQVVRICLLDSLHAALVNAWTSCGANGRDVVGHGAGNWSMAKISERIGPEDRASLFSVR